MQVSELIPDEWPDGRHHWETMGCWHTSRNYSYMWQINERTSTCTQCSYYCVVTAYCYMYSHIHSQWNLSTLDAAAVLSSHNKRQTILFQITMNTYSLSRLHYPRPSLLFIMEATKPSPPLGRATLLNGLPCHRHTQIS